MAAYDPEKITFFAKTDARGQQIPFGIKAKDRQRHMYVIGKTGMGKSTLLENMAAQDLQSGEGMAFIDPHGSAIEVLLEYVPEDRLDDVVYFAPFDMENPIAFNIMEDVGIDKRHLVVSGLMSTFKKIWVDAWSARMEYILTNALLALIEYPNTTLLSVNRMLADKKYRDKVVENIKDPAVKAYWVDEFASYTERFAAEALPAIQNKIGQFTGNPLIRNIIGQPKSSFDVRKMMDEKKILLINLSKGLVGETNADLIGSMLITKIYLAAMSRAELPPAQMKQMPNFYFYVDEFQSFANATFANILSEARKYHLNLIIAHQYIQQMEEEIRDAVFGNVGTTISFRVGPFDAEVLETVFAPEFEATDLVNLGFAQIYLSLMIDGVGSRPFSAVTLPPVQTPAKSHKHMAIKRSQQNFARPRAEVEQAVINSHSPDKRIADAAESGGGNKGGFAKPSFMKKVGSDQKDQPKKNGNGASNSQNGQNKNGNHQSKQPTKTAEDLKDILANMTGTTDKPKLAATAESTKEAPVKKIEPATNVPKLEPKPTADKPPEPKSEPTKPIQPKEVAKPTPSPKPTPSDRVPAANSRSDNKSNQNQNQNQAKTTPDDLRAILAQMTNKTNEAKARAEATPPNNRAQRPANNASRTNNHKPADLNQALKGVVKDRNQPNPNNHSARNTQPNQRADTRERTPAPHQPSVQKGNLKTTLAKVVAETNQANQAAEAKVASTAPIEQSSFGGIRQPAYVPHEQSSTPDINTAKKILRHSGKERPPGT
jgi:hypothetical protein